MRKIIIRLIAKLLFVDVYFQKSNKKQIFIEVDCDSEEATIRLNQLTTALKCAHAVANKLSAELLNLPIDTDFKIDIKKA